MPKPCIVCGQIAKPSRQGRCTACYTALLRHGQDRSVFKSTGPAGPRSERTPSEIAQFERELVEQVFKELGINVV